MRVYRNATREADYAVVARAVADRAFIASGSRVAFNACKAATSDR
jgi:hypothetical protein